MRTYIFIFIIFVSILNIDCTKAKYKNVKFNGFSIEVPYNWKKLKLKGIDSYVGGLLTAQKDSIIFDLGFYSNSLDIYQPIRDSVSLGLLKEGIEHGILMKKVDSIIFEINLDSLSPYVLQYKIIDSRKAKIIFPKKGQNGTTGVYFDSIWGHDSQQKVRFNFYGINLDHKEREEFIKAIGTLKFNK